MSNYPLHFIAGLGAVGMAAGAMSNRGDRAARAAGYGAVGAGLGAIGGKLLRNNNIAVARGVDTAARSTMNAGFKAAEAFSGRGMSKAAAMSIKGGLRMGKGMKAIKSIL